MSTGGGIESTLGSELNPDIKQDQKNIQLKKDAFKEQCLNCIASSLTETDAGLSLLTDDAIQKLEALKSASPDGDIKDHLQRLLVEFQSLSNKEVKPFSFYEQMVNAIFEKQAQSFAQESGVQVSLSAEAAATLNKVAPSDKTTTAENDATQDDPDKHSEKYASLSEKSKPLKINPGKKRRFF
jgi:hypothetical protein